MVLVLLFGKELLLSSTKIEETLITELIIDVGGEQIGDVSPLVFWDFGSLEFRLRLELLFEIVLHTEDAILLDGATTFLLFAILLRPSLRPDFWLLNRVYMAFECNAQI